MAVEGDLRNPEWEPSEAQEAAVAEDFRRTVLWRQAMVARGVKPYSLGLTVDQQHEAVQAWWRDEGQEQAGAER